MTRPTGGGQAPALQTMARESTGRAKSGRRRAVGALFALAGIAAVSLIALSAVQRAYFYGTYICGHCGAERTVDRQSIAGMTYRQRVTLRDTAVSRALKAGDRQECRHEWGLTRFGRGDGSLLGWSEIADGGSMVSVVRELLDDAAFARELAGMPRPREVWWTIWKANQTSPQEMNAMLGDWWGEGTDRQPFAQWWANNEGRVRELGSDGWAREIADAVKWAIAGYFDWPHVASSPIPVGQGAFLDCGWCATRFAADGNRFCWQFGEDDLTDYCAGWQEEEQWPVDTAV